MWELINFDDFSTYGIFKSEDEAWKKCFRLRRRGIACEPHLINNS
jgi:hypothetical protein